MLIDHLLATTSSIICSTYETLKQMPHKHSNTHTHPQRQTEYIYKNAQHRLPNRLCMITHSTAYKFIRICECWRDPNNHMKKFMKQSDKHKVQCQCIACSKWYRKLNDSILYAVALTLKWLHTITFDEQERQREREIESCSSIQRFESELLRKSWKKTAKFFWSSLRNVIHSYGDCEKSSEQTNRKESGK